MKRLIILGLRVQMKKTKRKLSRCQYTWLITAFENQIESYKTTIMFLEANK